MIKDLFTFIRNNLFIICTMMCGFCISAEYGITRPSVNSLFLASYSAKLIPYAWLLAVPINFLFVLLYNKGLSTFGCLKTFGAVVGITIFVNTFAAFFLTKIHYLPFFQAIWKDIYILLMFKQLWSLVHTTINTKKAKYVYGLLFGIGSTGAVAGGLLTSLLATKIGSQNLLFFTIPLYLLIFVTYFSAYKVSDLKKESHEEEKTPAKPFSLIKNSPLLTFVLLLVLLMQISTSLVDYQFNLMLERNLPDVDLRTRFSGQLHSLINGISIITGSLVIGFLVNILGLKKTHALIPCTLGTNALLLLLSPSFGMMTYAQTCIKVTDYSLFSTIKEMLYIPMKIVEKFHAKAIIDVFAYRGARAIASSFVLICQRLPSIDPFFIVGGISLSFFAIWIVTVFTMFRHYEYRLKIEEPTQEVAIAENE